MEKMRAQYQAERSVSISGIGSKFPTLTSHLKLNVFPFVGKLQGAPLLPARAFKWGVGTESSQREKYDKHIRAELKAEEISNLEWTTAPSHLLDSNFPTLPFKITGTSDYVIYLSSADLLPASGLVAVFEFKKVVPKGDSAKRTRLLDRLA